MAQLVGASSHIPNVVGSIPDWGAYWCFSLTLMFLSLNNISSGEDFKKVFPMQSSFAFASVEEPQG